MLDTESKHYVTWGLVLDLFVSKMEATTEEQITSKKPPLDHENKFKPSLHSKRETISKIIGVCSGPTYVYIVVSMILQNTSNYKIILAILNISKCNVSTIFIFHKNISQETRVLPSKLAGS